MLQDAARRAEYDSQLHLDASRQEVHVNETVCSSEMAPERVDGEACLAWPCRCGGQYLVAAGDVEGGHGGVLVPCTTCSLHIAVLPAGAGHAGGGQAADPVSTTQPAGQW